MDSPKAGEMGEYGESWFTRPGSQMETMREAALGRKT